MKDVSNSASKSNRESSQKNFSGWGMLILVSLLLYAVIFGFGYFISEDEEMPNSSRAVETAHDRYSTGEALILQIDSIPSGWSVQYPADKNIIEMRGPRLSMSNKRLNGDGPPGILLLFDCPWDRSPYMEMVAEDGEIRTEVHLHDSTDIGAPCEHIKLRL